MIASALDPDWQVYDMAWMKMMVVCTGALVLGACTTTPAPQPAPAPAKTAEIEQLDRIQPIPGGR